MLVLSLPEGDGSPASAIRWWPGMAVNPGKPCSGEWGLD